MVHALVMHEARLLIGCGHKEDAKVNGVNIRHRS